MTEEEITARTVIGDMRETSDKIYGILFHKEPPKDEYELPLFVVCAVEQRTGTWLVGHLTVEEFLDAEKNNKPPASVLHDSKLTGNSEDAVKEAHRIFAELIKKY